MEALHVTGAVALRTEPLTADALQTLIDFTTELWTIDGPRSEMHVGEAYTALFFDSRGEASRSTC